MKACGPSCRVWVSALHNVFLIGLLVSFVSSSPKNVNALGERVFSGSLLSPKLRSKALLTVIFLELAILEFFLPEITSCEFGFALVGDLTNSDRKSTRLNSSH